MLDFQYEKDLFYAAYKSFQEKRKIQVNLKTSLETENLRLKRSLIQQLKDVIENEEKIGSAFNAHKEIHETWKKLVIFLEIREKIFKRILSLNRDIFL